MSRTVNIGSKSSVDAFVSSLRRDMDGLNSEIDSMLDFTMKEAVELGKKVAPVCTGDLRDGIFETVYDEPHSRAINFVAIAVSRPMECLRTLISHREPRRTRSEMGEHYAMTVYENGGGYDGVDNRDFVDKPLELINGMISAVLPTLVETWLTRRYQ